MRAGLEQRLNRTWYGNEAPGIGLRLLEQLYRGGSALARVLERRRRAADLEGKPIIVVGNLAAGGSGKTPLVIALCDLARQAGLEPGVISRGYGRQARTPTWAEADSKARECGDEPLLIALRAGVPVRVDRNRENAARELFASGLNLVIADDGLQRLRLPRQLELCVVDGAHGLGNGRLLPAGPLREAAARLQSVDLVIENHGTHHGEAPDGRFSMHLEPGDLKNLETGETLTIAGFTEKPGPACAVAGIARPGRFFATLQGLGLDVSKRLVFPDHHLYRAGDFEGLPPGSNILMTEKDAVKCRGLGLHNAWYLPVSAVLEARLETALIDAMRKMNSNGVLK